jgi:hypothetical protein
MMARRPRHDRASARKWRTRVFLARLTGITIFDSKTLHESWKTLILKQINDGEIAMYIVSNIGLLLQLYEQSARLER